MGIETNTIVGAIIGGVALPATLYALEMHKRFSVYGGFDEDYAWNTVSWAIDSEHLDTFVMVGILGGIIGAIAGAAALRRR